MMDFTSFDTPDYPRAAIRRALLDSIPASDVDEVVDLACQAALQSRGGLLRTINLCSDQKRALAAFGVAWSLVLHDAETMMDAQKSFAKSTGSKAFEITVKG